MTKTGWRLDDYRTSIHKTADFGETWTSIGSDLPAGKPVNVIIQDRKNADLLFAGTEWGVYVTLDGGRSWLPFEWGMPSVKVTDLVIHPRENDLVIATYGRGAYVVDITPLQEMTVAVLDEDVHLFEIEPKTQRVTAALGNYQLLGDSHLFTPNEPNAVVVNYYLKAKTDGPVKVSVADPEGDVLAELEGKGEPGINTVSWDMRPRGRDEARLRRHRLRRRRAAGCAGRLHGTLEAAGKKLVKKAVIRYRQGWTVGPTPVVIH